MRVKALLSRLRTNTTISINAIKPIVEDVAKYNIRDLKLECKVMDLKDVTKTKHENAENNLVDLRFINYINDESDYHILNARMTVLFMKGKNTFRLELFGTISAKYENERYIAKLQEYLYSYMTKSLEENKDFMKFREIRFPDTLSSLYRNTPGWQSIQTMDFTWIDRNESETIAKITNGLLDNRSIINFDEETDDDGSDMVVNITYDGRRSI